MVSDGMLARLQTARKSLGWANESKFNKKRCQLKTADCTEVKEDSSGIVYWMQRDCRVQDNWALIFAQRMAHKAQVPLHVCFFTKPIREYYPTLRQYNFLLEGLSEVSKELKSLNINFTLINDTPLKLVEVIAENNIGGLVCDFSPLRQHRKLVVEIAEELSKLSNVPFIEVDAHNVVPCHITSEKQEIAARTIRSKIVKKLDEFLVEFPEVGKHEFPGNPLKAEHVQLEQLVELNKHLFDTTDMPVISWAKGGYKNGINTLQGFIKERLATYCKSRNDPSLDGQSNLSPWLHFGHISAQRCALEVKKTAKNDNTESFLEELIVRKELADNFCYYNKNYDNLQGADKWAQKTLNDHRNDKRQHVYSLEKFCSATTHDPIWDAAQTQLKTEGKLHGYMRMYWCKKILEWTESPEEAVRIALRLNDTYSLDGSDPNGFVGVMWSICGVHDHGWKERPVFGKVRFMVDYSLEKKFDIETYKGRYGVKEIGEGGNKKGGVKDTSGSGKGVKRKVGGGGSGKKVIKKM